MSQALHEQLGRELVSVQRNTILATGYPVAALGLLSVTVSTGPTKFHHRAIVCRHVTHDFIIGIDFLNKHDFDIKFSTLTLDSSLEPKRVQLLVAASTAQPCQVAVQETVVIPAFHEIVVPAATVPQPGHQSNMCCGMVEPRQEFVDRSQTLVARTLVNATAKDIPVRLANNTVDPQTIYKNTHVGHFVPIQDEERDYQTSVNSCEIETHPGLDSERPIYDQRPFDIEHLTSVQLNQLEPLVRSACRSHYPIEPHMTAITVIRLSHSHHPAVLRVSHQPVEFFDSVITRLLHSHLPATGATVTRYSFFS